MQYLVFDNSMLEAIAECETEAYLAWGKGLRAKGDTSAALAAGHAVHEALAAYLAANGTAAVAVARLRASLAANHAAFSVLPANHRLEPTNIEACLGHWLTQHRRLKTAGRGVSLAAMPVVFSPELLELPFAIPLGTAYPDGTGWSGIIGHDPNPAGGGRPEPIVPLMVGRMDAIGRDADSGHLVVVDHKTSGRLSDQWRDRWSYASQVSGYIWAAQQLTGHADIQHAVINGISLARVPRSQAKCRTHNVRYAECGINHLEHTVVAQTRSRRQLAEWYSETIMLLYHFLGMTSEWLGQTRGKFTGACAFCQFHDFCMLGPSPTYFASMHEPDAWRPVETLPRPGTLLPAETAAPILEAMHTAIT